MFTDELILIVKMFLFCLHELFIFGAKGESTFVETQDLHPKMNNKTCLLSALIERYINKARY